LASGRNPRLHKSRIELLAALDFGPKYVCDLARETSRTKKSIRASLDALAQQGYVRKISVEIYERIQDF
jgi:DNA-binding MarR family transcriptional regulator